MRRATFITLVLAVLAVPATAAAHATLVATQPTDGVRLRHGPHSIVVRFDDTVRVGSGNAAVDNSTGGSVLAGPPRARGRRLVLPLRRLGGGDYSVRWSIVSDDGHLERGVLAFAVGASAPPPHSILGAAVPLTWSDIVLRTLYYVGLLIAGGAAIFGLYVRTLLGPALVRPLAHLLFFALLAAFVGGSGIVHTAAPGTRYVLVLKLALAATLTGGVAAALAPIRPKLLWVAAGASLALLAAPTLSGHALDPNQPHLVSVPADLAHVVAAAAWLGGLAGLLYILPRAAPAAPERQLVVQRVSSAALAAVLVLAASGLARALTELSAPSQLWETPYGRTLLVKTSLLTILVVLGFLSRQRLRSAFAHLRRSVAVEVVLLLVVVVAVAVLTELRPGRDHPRSPPAAGSPADSR